MNVEEWMLPCMTKKTFGIECFGCGTQRAALLVLEGRFVEAFHLFPAIYPLILFFGFALLNFVDRKRNYRSLMTTMAIVSAVVMVVSYFMRHPFIFSKL